MHITRTAIETQQGWHRASSVVIWDGEDSFEILKLYKHTLRARWDKSPSWYSGRRSMGVKDTTKRLTQWTQHRWSKTRSHSWDLPWQVDDVTFFALPTALTFLCVETAIFSWWYLCYICLGITVLNTQNVRTWGSSGKKRKRLDWRESESKHRQGRHSYRLEVSIYSIVTT